MNFLNPFELEKTDEMERVLRVGIYDEPAMKVPLGPDRIKVPCERSLDKLFEKRPHQAGARGVPAVREGSWPGRLGCLPRRAIIHRNW